MAEDARESIARFRHRGYTTEGQPFDAVVLGYYVDNRLIYAARKRNGFTPALRVSLMKLFKKLEIAECPFVIRRLRHTFPFPALLAEVALKAYILGLMAPLGIPILFIAIWLYLLSST